MKLTKGSHRLHLYFRTWQHDFISEEDLDQLDNLIVKNTDEIRKQIKKDKEAKRKEAAGGTHTGNTTV